MFNKIEDSFIIQGTSQIFQNNHSKESVKYFKEFINLQQFSIFICLKKFHISTLKNTIIM